MNHNNLSRLAFFGLSLFFLFAVVGCHADRAGIHIGDDPPPAVVAPAKPGGGPPPHAPAHGYRAKHQYHYYPASYVYFDLSRKCYFYLEGDSWKVSASLPTSVSVGLGDYVSIEMDTDKPYTQFDEHRKKYPPGQLKKKKNGKWS
jgi:hypothetical protein